MTGRAMTLEGSCHCKAVTFRVSSSSPVPFNLCYCDICRKTAGAGGFAINLGADFATLKVEGRAAIRTYNAHLADGSQSLAERSFCGTCGSQLWLWDPRWPALVHPHASAIDTPLPRPAMRWHMMTGEKPDWVVDCAGDGDRQFQTYPDQSLSEWHKDQQF